MKHTSEHALVAKEIRKILKAHNVKGSVRSGSFAGGNACRVSLTDVNPAVVEKIKEETSVFSAGSFNGMEDLYEYHSNRSGPTVKYLTVESDYSDENINFAYSVVASEYNLTGSYKEHMYDRIGADYVCTLVRNVIKDFSENFNLSGN